MALVTRREGEKFRGKAQPALPDTHYQNEAELSKERKKGRRRSKKKQQRRSDGKKRTPTVYICQRFAESGGEKNEDHCTKNVE